MIIPKREPLLADRFLSERNPTPIVPRQYWETTRDNLMLAKRFVFDEEATKYCAELLHQVPRIIADAQDFAIPPFERTYIEIPFRVWYEILTGRGNNLKSVRFSDKTVDYRVGYLIVGPLVRSIACGMKGDAALSPVQYHLNQPWSIKQQLAVSQSVGVSRIALDLFFWGESALSFMTPEDQELVPTSVQKDFVPAMVVDERQKEGLRSLRANHSFSIHLKDGIDERKAWDSFYDGSAGDLRNIIGLLLFLNRTTKTQVLHDVPIKRQMIGNRPAVLLKHTMVKIHVNPVPKLLHLAAGEGIWRRLHDVRGHFCHNKTARENHHDHVWDETEGPHILQWYCSCGGLRWWRKEHKRGHEEIGRVTSTYEVSE